MDTVTISIERYDELIKKEATLEILTRFYKEDQYVSAAEGKFIIGNTEEQK